MAAATPAAGDSGVAVTVDGAGGRQFHIWQADGAAHATFPAPPGETYVWSPKGTRVVALAQGRAMLHTLGTAEAVDLGPADAAAFSPLTARLAIARGGLVRVSSDQRVEQWNDVSLPEQPVSVLAWAGESGLVCVAGEPPALVTIDLETHKARTWIRSGKRRLVGCAPRPGGAAVALLWETLDGTPAYTLLDFNGPKHVSLYTATSPAPLGCTWAPDGAAVVLLDGAPGGERRLVRVDVATGESTPLTGATGAVSAPVFAPDTPQVAYLQDHQPAVFLLAQDQSLSFDPGEARVVSPPQWVRWNDEMRAQLARQQPMMPTGFANPAAALEAVAAALGHADYAALSEAAIADANAVWLTSILRITLRENPDAARELGAEMTAIADEGGEPEYNPAGTVAAFPYVRPDQSTEHYIYFARTLAGGWAWDLALTNDHEDGPLPW